jgi:endonuclease/exonuclease/phosphatase family metal-dependent hydrolase
MKQRILKYWYVSALLPLSLLSYTSVYISPQHFWPAIFLAFAIPFVIAINGVVLLICLVVNRRLAIFPALGLLVGVPFILNTFKFNTAQNRRTGAISILSFNAKLFREKHTYSKFSAEMIEWTVKDSSDIKCIQEYSTNPYWDVIDVTGNMRKQGYHTFAFKSKLKNNLQSNGLAIFSKFPMLDSGIVWENPNSPNGIIYADVLINQDTLRIYNAHIESMSLQPHQLKSLDNYSGKLKILITKLRYGSANRVDQITQLMQHAGRSPYRFIICGDFNETPYGYNYHTLKSQFRNAFEEAGNGFGFTLNGGLFFLRIDHQFYGEGIQVLDYRVDKKMDISDHFPTFAHYVLE